MSQPVRSSALNFSSPWLVETPESFVILDAADAWVFLQPRGADFHLGNLHPSMAPPSFM
jgi:hypothetical protein